MAIVDSPADFQIGRVVSRTFNVLASNAPVFLGAAALLTFPILLLSFLSGGYPTPGAAATALHGGMLTVAAVLIFSFVGGVLLQAVLMQATVTYLNREKPALGKCLATAFGLFFPLVGLTILFSLGLGLGIILLVIPGVMLLTAWVVVVPVRVSEDVTVADAFGRSRALTKGHRWKIFALLLIYLVLATLLELAMYPLVGATILHPTTAALSPIAITLGWVVRVVAAAISATGTAVLYYELRTVKEGISPQDLAATFD